MRDDYRDHRIAVTFQELIWLFSVLKMKNSIDFEPNILILFLTLRELYAPIPNPRKPNRFSGPIKPDSACWIVKKITVVTEV